MLIPIGWQLKLRRLQRHLETGDWLASHSITAQFRHVFPRGDWSKAAFDHLSARALDPITSNVNAIDANSSLASISTTESKCVCVCVPVTGFCFYYLCRFLVTFNQFPSACIIPVASVDCRASKRIGQKLNSPLSPPLKHKSIHRPLDIILVLICIIQSQWAWSVLETGRYMIVFNWFIFSRSKRDGEGWGEGAAPIIDLAADTVTISCRSVERVSFPMQHFCQLTVSVAYQGNHLWWPVIGSRKCGGGTEGEGQTNYPKKLDWWNSTGAGSATESPAAISNRELFSNSTDAPINQWNWKWNLHLFLFQLIAEDLDLEVVAIQMAGKWSDGIGSRKCWKCFGAWGIRSKLQSSISSRQKWNKS